MLRSCKVLAHIHIVLLVLQLLRSHLVVMPRSSSQPIGPKLAPTNLQAVLDRINDSFTLPGVFGFHGVVLGSGVIYLHIPHKVNQGLVAPILLQRTLWQSRCQVRQNLGSP